MINTTGHTPDCIALPVRRLGGRLGFTVLPWQSSAAALADLMVIESPFMHGWPATRDDALKAIWRHHPRFFRHIGEVAPARRALALWSCFWSAFASGRLAWPEADTVVRAKIQRDIATIPPPRITVLKPNPTHV